MDRQTIMNRGKKASVGTKGNNNGRAPSYRTYCPECLQNMTDPERTTHVVVDAGTARVTGACRHSWLVGSQSR